MKVPLPDDYEVVDRDEGVDWSVNLLETLFRVVWMLVIILVTVLTYPVCYAYRNRRSKE